MCSICGIAEVGGERPPREGERGGGPETVVRNMLEIQAARGPDGSGVFLSPDGFFALGHARLAIIDPVRGKQPFASGDGAVALAINGEIYNHRALRDALGREHHFQSDSDGEVLLHLYEERGIDAVRELDGMFAFALYDGKKHILHLGRDRWGKKPLNYCRTPEGGVVFASLISALSAAPGFPAEPDKTGIRRFLAYQSFEPEKSVYRKVLRVPPGSVTSFDLQTGKSTTASFLKKAAPAPAILPERKAAAEKLRELVFRAVEKRLESDVPMGAFLSGGTDSAVICAILNRFPKGREMPLFTAVLPGSRYDESAQAKETAAFLGKSDRHYLLEVKLPDLELLKKLIRHAGEPLGDASILPVSLICEAAKQHISVALGGDGADELFGGYERYRLLETGRRLDRFVPRSLWRGAARMLDALPLPESRSFGFRLRRAFAVLGTAPFLRYAAIRNKLPHGETLEPGPETAAEAMEYDIRNYLPGDTLPKLDLGSMFHALEVRSPFLDDEVAEFAATLPVKFKLDAFHGKKILRDAFAPLLPKSVWSGRKHGFGVPLGELLRREWRDEAAEILGNIDDDEAKTSWQEHLSGRVDRSEFLWNRISLEIFNKEGA